MAANLEFFAAFDLSRETGMRIRRAGWVDRWLQCDTLDNFFYYQPVAVGTRVPGERRRVVAADYNAEDLRARDWTTDDIAAATPPPDTTPTVTPPPTTPTEITPAVTSVTYPWSAGWAASGTALSFIGGGFKFGEASWPNPFPGPAAVLVTILSNHVRPDGNADEELYIANTKKAIHKNRSEKSSAAAFSIAAGEAVAVVARVKGTQIYSGPLAIAITVQITAK